MHNKKVQILLKLCFFILVFAHSNILFESFISYFEIQPYKSMLFGQEAPHIQSLFFNLFIGALYYFPLYYVQPNFRKDLFNVYSCGIIITGVLGLIYLLSQFITSGLVKIAIFLSIFFLNPLTFSLEAILQVYLLYKKGEIPLSDSFIHIALTWALRISCIISVAYIMPLLRRLS